MTNTPEQVLTVTVTVTDRNSGTPGETDNPAALRLERALFPDGTFHDIKVIVDFMDEPTQTYTRSYMGDNPDFAGGMSPNEAVAHFLGLVLA